MLSRDADACFWIGRYVERAEATARMVDVHYHAALESGLPGIEGADSPMRWDSLLAISHTAEEFYKHYDVYSDRNFLHHFAFDTENPNSILVSWSRARENARSIREQIASEMWEAINISYLQFRDWDVDRILAEGPHAFFNRVKNASHLFQGILNRTLLMSETRDWLDIGRFLERGDQTARLLDVKYHDLLPAYQEEDAESVEPLGVGSTMDMHGWIAVLKSVSAFEMYRKIYRGGILPASVVDFLVLHPQFPASVNHCVKRVEGCLKRISGNSSSAPSTEPERVVGRLVADLTYSRPEEIILEGLHEFLDGVQVRCIEIGNAITRTYLSY